MQPFSFYLIADPHYFAQSLQACGEEYEEFMDREQKCFAETAAVNLAVEKFLLEDEIKTILIAGDLSFNGEKASHEEYSRLLKRLADAGKDIYVITAGHDIEKNPFQFCEKEGRKSVEGISFSDLYGYYRDFGYDKAISLYKENLSYMAQLCDGVRLLALCNDSENEKNIAYTPELLEWAQSQLDKARQDGQTVIAMQHYPLLASQPILTLVPDARQKNAAETARFLADNAVRVIFTGHMHNQSVNEFVSENGNKITDVCTGSLIGHPAFMRKVTIDGGMMDIKSVPVPEFEWQGRLCGEEYLKRQFERMIRHLTKNLKTDPASTLSKLGIKANPPLLLVAKKAGVIFSDWSVGAVARLLCVRCDPQVKDVPFIELAVDIVRNLFEGDQPFVEGTPMGDTLLRAFKRFRPVLRLVSKKLKGSQGESVDLYEMLKHSVGNYSVSDSQLSLSLK